MAMKPETLRTLRGVELLRWIAARFGNGDISSWRIAAARNLGLSDSFLHQWRYGDASGRCQDRIEKVAREHGFVSYYDVTDIKRLAHHEIILNQVLASSHWHETPISKWRNKRGDVVLPLTARDLEILVAALNYPLVDVRPRTDTNPLTTARI